MTQDFDEARRQALARGWAASPLDQKTYAAQNGISARTLREWVRRYGVTSRPAARAIAIIDMAIAQLQVLRAGVVAEEACQVGGRDGGGEQDERHAAPGVEPPSPNRTVLDALVLAVENVTPDDEVGAASESEQQSAVRPLALPLDWMRGGGGFIAGL
jgi:hypothetical protein